MTRKTELKIKIMSLAAEARIIRREEGKWPGRHPKRAGLHEHRVIAVRRESRRCLLAYGFLRGRAYRRLERSCRHAGPVDWGAVADLVARFGGLDRLAEWSDAAA